jgi:hypothetical protein
MCGSHVACSILLCPADCQRDVKCGNLGKVSGLWYTVPRPMVRVADS